MIETVTALLPHQLAAISKLERLKVSALFMEMGTGKTRTVIEMVKCKAHKIDRVVYFCPVNLKQTVVHELQIHCTDPSICVFSDRTQQGNIPKAFWYIVGTESIGQSDRVTLAANELITGKTYVILDESDTCKNHKAIRTQRLTMMAAKARYRTILTGTPVGEGYEDLYAQMYFLSPEILGYKSFYSFAANHLEYSEKFKGMVVENLNTEYISQRIEPFVFQVKKEECLSLPDKLYESRYCSLTGQQRELYDRAKYEILMQCPDDEIDSYTIFRLFTALREIVSGFWNRTPDPNLPKHLQHEPELLTVQHDRLELLETAFAQIPENEKVIIWSSFQYSSNQIIDLLGTENCARHDGTVRDRASELSDWRNDKRFLIISPKCGGRGLTLNEAAYTIFYNNDFPYRLREQAEDRNHRIGQQRRPTYIDLVCSGSIDDRIFRSLRKKENLVQAFKRELDKLKTGNQRRQKLMKI